MHEDTRLKQMRAMRAERKTLQEIADHFGISKQRVDKILNPDHPEPELASNDFAAWRIAMGFTRKQVAEAASLIGYKEGAGSLMHRGERELTDRDRLAMAARRAGLNPWTPANDHEAVAALATVEAIRRGRAA